MVSVREALPNSAGPDPPVKRECDRDGKSSVMLHECCEVSCGGTDTVTGSGMPWHCDGEMQQRRAAGPRRVDTIYLDVVEVDCHDFAVVAERVCSATDVQSTR